jgi:hypothetical protein
MDRREILHSADSVQNDGTNFREFRRERVWEALEEEYAGLSGRGESRKRSVQGLKPTWLAGRNVAAEATTHNGIEGCDPQCDGRLRQGVVR